MNSGCVSGLQSGSRTPAYYQAQFLKNFLGPNFSKKKKQLKKKNFFLRNLFSKLLKETPLMFSRRSTPSASSLESVDMPDNASDSEPESRPLSGNISPSDIPDSPGQHIMQEEKKRENANGLTNYQPVTQAQPTTLFPPNSIHSNPMYPSANQNPVKIQSTNQMSQPPTNPVQSGPNMIQPTPTQPITSSQVPISQPINTQYFPPPQTFQMYNSYQPYSNDNIQSYSNNYGDFDDDGPVAFAEEGSMSPRSRTNLSELTIDSKSEPPSNIQKTQESLKFSYNFTNVFI